jgi:hypothetical protein
MKFVTSGAIGNPEAAAHKLLELAQSFEPVQDRRIYVEEINAPMRCDELGYWPASDLSDRFCKSQGRF